MLNLENYHSFHQNGFCIYRDFSPSKCRKFAARQEISFTIRNNRYIPFDRRVTTWRPRSWQHAKNLRLEDIRLDVMNRLELGTQGQFDVNDSNAVVDMFNDEKYANALHPKEFEIHARPVG